MSEIALVELWELFTGRRERHDFFDRSGYDSDSRIDLHYPIQWNEINDIAVIVANPPQNQPFTDYLLRILWIREFKFGMHALKMGDTLTFVTNAFILTGIEIHSTLAQYELNILLEEGYIQGIDEDHWHPGMPSGSGWTTVYPLTLKGKKVAEKRMHTVTAAVDTAPVSPPIKPVPPWKRQTVESPPVVPETQIAGNPVQIQAATGKGIPKSAAEVLEEYQEWIEEADAPADVVVKNEEPIPVRDAGVAGDMLWALTISKQPDDKLRRWSLWKSGVGYIEIAKSEHPDWESEYGKEQAQKLWTSEADIIRKQVKSVEERVKKSHQNPKANKSLKES